VRAAAAALLVMALAACAAHRVPVTPMTPHRFAPDDRAAIAAVIESQRLAWNRGDLDAYMDGYARTDALVFTSGGNIRHGWQDALDHYRARYGGDKQGMGTLAFEVLSIDAVGADGAVVLGKWQLTDTAQAGGGVFTLVFERRAEGWRIVHDHTSTSMPSH
jgi:ketosteroid isomerase-like protein